MTCTVAADHGGRRALDRQRRRSKRRCLRRSKLLPSAHKPASDPAPSLPSPTVSEGLSGPAPALPWSSSSAGGYAPPTSEPAPDEVESEPPYDEVESEPPHEEVTSEGTGSKEAPRSPFRFFAPGSFWNEQLPADAPLESDSSARIHAFVEQIDMEEQTDDGPWINTTRSGIPVYTVPADQPTVSVQLVSHTPEPALSSAWSAVPLPPTAQPASGHDGDLIVWQPSTERLWEFGHMIHEADGWQAEWGGAMQDVSSRLGVYGPEAWPGAQSWWGTSASSLSLVGGLIFIEDLELGQINHALEMSLPERAATVYASPAPTN